MSHHRRAKLTGFWGGEHAGRLERLLRELRDLRDVIAAGALGIAQFYAFL
jgi:hypothetical protein